MQTQRFRHRNASVSMNVRGCCVSDTRGRDEGPNPGWASGNKRSVHLWRNTEGFRVNW
jgi:hypothetical protein